MSSKILIGTSGFGIGRGRSVQEFPCVEVQHTFYQPPRISTLERWRAEAPADFEFVLKAWQLITHDAKSPTYRRLKRPLTEKQKMQAGYFRQTPIVEEAWQLTLACAKALKARTILFQCPRSFTPTKQNIANLKKFFTRIRAGNERLNFCWEPRGDWDTRGITQICESLGLWHAVDPFVTKTVTPKKLYFRLHGKGGWRYEYDENELRELAGILPKRTKGYVFFNNVRMVQDAQRFREILNVE